jgi:hypothetical protein
MIKLELDDNQAWFLTQLLEQAIEEADNFLTVDENEDLTFDADFKEHIEEVQSKLLKARGF